jgi:hypothetical protein
LLLVQRIWLLGTWQCRPTWMRTVLLTTTSICAHQTRPVRAQPTTALGVRVYLVDYIFCIIDCHICRDIFGMIDIMYYRLPYLSRCALPLKTLVLYISRLLYSIYTGREAQCNTTNNYTQSILHTWYLIRF